MRKSARTQIPPFFDNDPNSVTNRNLDICDMPFVFL